MRIQVLSDLHLEMQKIPVVQTDADVVVLAGDIDNGVRGIVWARATFPNQPVVFVGGNHDAWGGHWIRSIDKMRAAAAGSNVYFLEDDEVIVQGTRFLGCSLWTDFGLLGADRFQEAMATAKNKMNDYRKIRAPTVGSGLGGDYAKLTPIQTVRRHNASREFLRSRLSEPFSGPTVVVTHHAPHPMSIPLEYRDNLTTTAYASDLSEMLRNGPDCWIHGHLHVPVEYQIGKTTVVSNPRGYPGAGFPLGNPHFDPGFIVELSAFPGD